MCKILDFILTVFLIVAIFIACFVAGMEYETKLTCTENDGIYYLDSGMCLKNGVKIENKSFGYISLGTKQTRNKRRK